MSPFLFESDARGLIRLLGETAIFDTNQTGKMRFLMDGLCDLVGASAWVWGYLCESADCTQTGNEALLYGGPDEARFARLLGAFEYSDTSRLAQLFFDDLARRNRQSERDRPQFGPHPAFSHTEASIAWQDAGFGAVIISRLPEGGQSTATMSAIALYRRSGMPEFTERDHRIAHLVFSELPWLRVKTSTEDLDSNAPRLYARQRIILKLLLEGQDRKSIADQLEISVNTVSGYCKEIYRHFGINSQAALMARFYLGNGGDMT